MEKELVSVIIPVYNSSDYIEECITSVLKGSYKNIEIIIINDVSSDDSLNKIKKINDKRIKLYTLDKNSGVAIARNKGIELSKGSFICFLDSDDIYEKNKIKNQLEFMIKNDLTFTYTNFIYVKKNGKKHNAKTPKKLNYKGSLKNTAILTSTVMLNMNKLSKDDIYMPNLKKGQDTATWWKILKKNVTAYRLNEYDTLYRVHNNSLSFNKINAIKRTWNLYIYEGIKMPIRLFYFSCYAFNALKRRIL